MSAPRSTTNVSGPLYGYGHEPVPVPPAGDTATTNEPIARSRRMPQAPSPAPKPQREPKDAASEETPKPKPEARFDAVVPQLGVRGKLQKYFSGTDDDGFQRTLPVSGREQRVLEAERARLKRVAAHEAQLAAKRDAELKARESLSTLALRKASDKAPQGSIAVLNTKGAAGKTTFVVNLTSVLSELLRSLVFAIDANPASGQTAARLGRDIGETVTALQISQQREDIAKVTKRLLTLARPNKYGVRTVSANSIIGPDARLSSTDWQIVLALLQDRSEYNFFDIANDITQEVILSILRMMDQFVFTAWKGERDSLRQLGTSMQSLRFNGMDELVDRSVVIITGLEPGEDIEQYRMYLHLVNKDDEVVERFPDFNGPFLGIHHDDEIAKAGIVKMEAWNWQTGEDYRQAGIAVLQQLAQAPNREQPGIAAVPLIGAPQFQLPAPFGQPNS